MDIFRPGGLDMTAKAAKYIGLKAGERVLDIGCGLGTSLCFLRDNYNIEPSGLELNPETAKRAALNLGVDRIYCGDTRRGGAQERACRRVPFGRSPRVVQARRTQ